MADRSRLDTDVRQALAGRSAAYWGSAFVLLLVVSAGMVTVPGEDRGVPFVRNFYDHNRTVIVIAQVIGLAAALAFLAFARGLQRSHRVGAGSVGVRLWVRRDRRRRSCWSAAAAPLCARRIDRPGPTRSRRWPPPRS